MWIARGYLFGNYVGVHVLNSTGVSVTGLAITENTRGIHIGESKCPHIKDIVIRDSSYTGIYFESSTDDYTASNTITENHGYGIVINAESEGIRISLNSFCDNIPHAGLVVPGAKREVESNL